VKSRYSNMPGRSVTINYTPGKNCMVRAGDLLKDVFDNLVDNAIRHSTGPVTIDLAIDQVNLEGRCYYRVTVTDNGPGIPPELKKNIFMTLREMRERTVRRGFGLYLVGTLVNYYHGQVCVEDRVPGDYTKGARFVVLLPIAA
jgi:signal transduction histidine kinase